MRRGDGRVERFFAAWKRFSDKLARLLVTMAGLISIVMAFQAHRYFAPLWVSLTFAVFGLGLLVMNFARR